MFRRIHPLIRRGATAWVSLAAFVVLLGTGIAWQAQVLGATSYLAGATLLSLVLAICCHDAIHRAAHRSRGVNELVGWFCAFWFGAPFSVYRRAHLLHHAHADAPDDPERFAYFDLRVSPLLWPVSNWMYLRAIRHLPPAARWTAIPVLGTWTVALALWPQALLVGWLLPMQVASAIFACATVTLPHGRAKHIVMRLVPAITGYHEDHHAMPSYPVHQYRTIHRWRRTTVHAARQVEVP